MDSTSGSGSSAAAVDAALANSSVAPLHQQPGDKPRKTVHLIYDYMYEFAEDYRVHLPDLGVPIVELGYILQEHFISPANMLERLRDIPRNDPNHIVFVHVDMPEKSAVGSKLETVHYMEREFKYIVGFRAKYSENCTWKSTMNTLFAKNGVRYVPSVRVATVEELRESQIADKIRTLTRPYFIKVDDGCNSLGLSNSCVLHDVDSLLAKAKEMITSYGPVIIQKFVGGREYTVAVTNGRAYHPVERIFGAGDLVSQPGGTPTEKPMDFTETARIKQCQELSLAAYSAVGGSCYGRVDLREDPETGDIYVLEVNNTCSLAPSSYFQISVETVGSSKKAVIAEILHEAEAIAAAEGAATVTAGSDTAYIYSSTTASTAFATNNVHTTNATTTTTTTNAPSLLHREPSAVSESEHAQGEAALVMG